jgi:surface antigen
MSPAFPFWLGSGLVIVAALLVLIFIKEPREFETKKDVPVNTLAGFFEFMKQRVAVLLTSLVIVLAAGAALGFFVPAAGAIGAEIGRRMDQADRSCVGHALELAQPGQTVAWKNHNTGIAYQLTPVKDANQLSDGCRKFRLIATGGFGLSEGRTVACAGTDGKWRLEPEVRLGQR